MKTLLLTLLTLPLFSQAQYREVSGDFFPNAKVEKSYLVNGFFEKNTNAVTATTHTAVRNTTAPIQGAGDLQITASAAGNTRINTLAWEKRLEGQNCELSFKYTGGGGTWTAQIWDGSLNVLVSRPLPAVTLVSPISMNYPCGSVSGRTIRFVTTASAPQLNVDEIYYGLATNIINLSNDTDFINAGTITFGAVTTAPIKGTVVRDSVKYALTGGKVRFRYEWQQSTGGTNGTGNYLISLPAGMTWGPDVVLQTGTPTDTGFAGGFINFASNYRGYAHVIPYDATRFRLHLVVGQSSSGSGGAAFWTSGDANIQFTGAVSMSLDFEAPINGFSATQQAVTQQCIQDGSCENVFSAYIDTAGAVFGEQINWINGNCTKSGTNNSQTTCNLVPGFFSNGQDPICTATPRFSGGTGGFVFDIIANAAANTISFRNLDANNVLRADNVHLVCQRSGTDYRPRFAAPILTGSVTSSSASPLRMETAYIQTNGNVLFGSTPGFFSCGATLPRTCTFAQPFAANPVCTATMDGRARIAAVTSVTTTAVILEAGDLAGSLSNTNNMHLICIGPRLQ